MAKEDRRGHGGDIYRNDVELDFSTNVNPFGMPKKVADAIRAAVGTLPAYPDPCCAELREKLAASLGAEPADVICGNGAAELIYQFALALKPGKALLPVPSFSEYENALVAAGCTPSFYPLRREEGFALTDGVLEEIREGTELLLLCSPNNPTGVCVGWELLLRILDRCRETGTWLFLDECFLEFTDEGKDRSLIPKLRKDDKVFVLRAFTKMFGMAGIRLGYAVCPRREMTDRMRSLSQPWNVSSLAQAAGIAALDCGDWQERTRRTIFTEKRYLLHALRQLGISVLPGDANFLLLSGVPDLYEYLLVKKILIRSCGNYRGLDGGDCRISVRTREDNEALIAAIREKYHA